jgi:hypothetical protein
MVKSLKEKNTKTTFAALLYHKMENTIHRKNKMETSDQYAHWFYLVTGTSLMRWKLITIKEIQ